MAIRNQQKISSLGIVPGLSLILNPFAQQVGSARILRNFVPERGRLARKSFSSNFITSSASSSTWHTKNFRYTRASAPQNEILAFKANGRVYKRIPSAEQEIFPGSTSFSVLNKKPFVGQLGNRFFWHDGSAGYVYDGRDIQSWGIDRETSAPSTSATGTGLTMATGLKAAITWVVLDEAGNRVHESSRSDVAAFQILTNENLQIDKSGLSDDARATHWSGYACLSDNNYTVGEDGMLRSISELVPGDRIWSNPSLVEVVATARRPAKGIYPDSENGYRITSWCNSAFPIEGTGNHRLLCANVEKTYQRVEPNVGKGDTWTRGKRRMYFSGIAEEIMQNLDEIKEGSFLTIPVREISALEKIPLPSPKTNKGKFRFNHPKPTRDWGFVVGLYLAEGCPSKSRWNVAICLGSSEKFLADRFQKVTGVPYSKPQRNKGSKGLIYFFCDTRLTHWLADNFGFTDSKRIPDWCWETGREFLLGIVEGLILGDGHITPTEPIVTFCNTRPQLTLRLRDAIASLGLGYGSINKREAGFWYGRNCKEIFSVHFCHQVNEQLRQVFSWPESRETLKTQGRHWYYSPDKKKIYVRVRKIERCELEEVYDIQVNHPEHRYCLPAAITHNSELDGSEILRRTNTTLITTDTFIVTALPAALDPKAPVRNDPPPKSTVGEVTKNRIFLRDEQSPEQFWFSALGEVKGLNNGAPDESFPGKDSSSISDLSNNDFIPDREISAIKEHNNIIFLFSERRGFGLTGELSLLDNRAPRDMTKLEVFTEGCTGADAIESTPFGLVWFTPGRKLWLWAGGQELIDIGEPIQTLLGTIPAGSLDDVYMKWWEGNGRQWLVIALNSRDGESPDDSSTLAQRTLIYDFSLPSPRPDRAQPDPGSWIEWDDIAATCVGTYIANDGQEFLLIGDSSGNVKQADTIVSPCHLNRSMILGECYLGSTVQNNPQADMRTSLLLPSSDQWSVGHYLQLLTGDQNDPGTPSAGDLTEPTISSWIDPTSVDSPGTAITLTLDSALTSGDKRAWLVPDTTNTTAAGAFAKQFLFQAQYAAGVDDTGNADNRETNRINTIYKMGFTWSPKPEMAL